MKDERHWCNGRAAGPLDPKGKYRDGSPVGGSVHDISVGLAATYTRLLLVGSLSGRVSVRQHIAAILPNSSTAFL